MATRPKGFGMTAELQRKKDAKRDLDAEQQVQTWIEDCLDIKFDPSLTYMQNLKDGKLLCKLMNKVRKPLIKINESNMAFKEMENIGKFLQGADSLGVAKTNLFQTVDLYEGQNIPAVTTGIMAFARKCSELQLDLPVLGPAEVTANRRDFTEEELRYGEQVIGLQSGANMSGDNIETDHFGRQRFLLQ